MFKRKFNERIREYYDKLNYVAYYQNLNKPYDKNRLTNDYLYEFARTFFPEKFDAEPTLNKFTPSFCMFRGNFTWKGIKFDQLNLQLKQQLVFVNGNHSVSLRRFLIEECELTKEECLSGIEKLIISLT